VLQKLHHYTNGLLSNESKTTLTRPPAVFTFRTRQRKSRKRAKSSPPVQASIKKTVRGRLSTSKQATASCLASIRAARSNSTATNSSSCAKTRSSASFHAQGQQRNRVKSSKFQVPSHLEPTATWNLKLGTWN